MAAAPRTIRAAGAVVLRGSGADRQVALVHRDRYDDWSLPKGKLHRHERARLAAVREVAEETGLRVRLGVPLDATRYTVGRRPKEVRWWVASVLADEGHTGDDEVDEMRWFPVAKARRRLSQPQERKVLAQALAQPATTPVIVLRHGKAISRRRWGKRRDDRLRPLSRRGQRQAEWLVDGLAPWDPAVVVTSPSARCAATVAPFAASRGLVPVAYEVLTEETGSSRPAAVAATVRDLVAATVLRDDALVLCGHRPVLPAVLAGVGVPDRPLDVGALLVAHVTTGGEVVALEHVRNTRPA